MKESKLIEMHKKIETLSRVAQQLIGELNHLKDLSIGTLETVKLLPGYKEAIEQLIEKNTKNGKEENTDGSTTGDSGLIITDE